MLVAVTALEMADIGGVDALLRLRIRQEMSMSRKNEATPATGISNRESAEEEQAERQRFPPAQGRSGSPGAKADGGESAAGDGENEQTSSKTGSRSGAQKAAEAKYVNRSHPASEKVDGAFGREPGRQS
jgi:hypothetical protein